MIMSEKKARIALNHDELMSESHGDLVAKVMDLQDTVQSICADLRERDEQLASATQNVEAQILQISSLEAKLKQLEAKHSELQTQHIEVSQKYLNTYKALSALI
jgi:phage shock protein A